MSCIRGVRGRADLAGGSFDNRWSFSLAMQHSTLGFQASFAASAATRTFYGRLHYGVDGEFGGCYSVFRLD
jgi:hypothetical protein